MSNLLQIQNGKRLIDKTKAERLVVIFHGYGSNRENLYDLGEALSLHNPTFRFIIPNGIQNFEEGAGGYQWFSLRDYTQKAMERGLANVTPKISEWVKTRLNELNLTQDNLYLAGFSQGAMLSLYLAASKQLSPKKIIAFSGVFIPPKEANTTDKAISILAIHGDRDQILPINMTEESYKLLPHYGLNKLHYISEKGIEHYITPQAITEANNFLRAD